LLWKLVFEEIDWGGCVGLKNVKGNSVLLVGLSRAACFPAMAPWSGKHRDEQVPQDCTRKVYPRQKRKLAYIHPDCKVGLWLTPPGSSELYWITWFNEAFVLVFRGKSLNWYSPCLTYYANPQMCRGFYR